MKAALLTSVPFGISPAMVSNAIDRYVIEYETFIKSNFKNKIVPDMLHRAEYVVFCIALYDQ